MKYKFLLLAPAVCALVVVLVVGNSNPINDVERNNPSYREYKATIDANETSVSGQIRADTLSAADDGSASTATTARTPAGQ